MAYHIYRTGQELLRGLACTCLRGDQIIKGLLRQKKKSTRVLKTKNMIRLCLQQRYNFWYIHNDISYLLTVHDMLHFCALDHLPTNVLNIQYSLE